MLRVFVEPREFARFILAGGTAAFTNMGAVWVARHVLSFGAALTVGVAAGFLMSFLLTKIYAFKKAASGTRKGEAARFTIVYAVGAGVYWSVSFGVCAVLVLAGLKVSVAEMIGTFAGNVTMAAVTYAGHRFFTFKTFPS